MLDRWPLVLARFSIRRPWLSIALLLGLTLAAAPGLLRLELRTDGHALVPQDDPVVRLDAAVREHFGLRDPVVVLLRTRHPDGLYNLGTLTRVQKLSEALAALPGVGTENVVSLATEHRDRVYTGTLNFRPFLDPLPSTPELMQELRGDMAAAPIMKGTLISYDGTAAAIHVGTPSGHGATVDRIAFYKKVRALADRFAGGGDEIDVAGAPVAEALLGTHILEDLVFLLPLSLAVICLVMWLGCRRLWGVLLPLANVGACQIATFGLMGWVGAPVHLTTAMLPVILTTLAVADEIHLFWHYQHVLARTETAATADRAVERTMERLVRPVTFTCVTTSLGFLSFLSSPIEPVRSFGLFAGLGVLFCLAWSLLVTPAALTLLGPARLARPVRPAGARRPVAARASRLAELPLRRPGLTLAVLAVLTVALGAGVARLVVQDSWIDGFAPGSPFHEATQRVNHHLHGNHILQIELTFPPPPAKEEEDEFAFFEEPVQPLETPEVLDAIGGLEDALRKLPRVGGVLGPKSHLVAVTYLWQGRREEARQVPRDPYRIRQAWERFDMARGERRRREVVDDAKQRGIVTVFLKDANYRDTADLMTAVRGYTREHLGRFGAKLGFAGDVAVSQAMIPAIVRTQVSSVLLALVSSFLAVALATRSLKTAALTIVPVSVAVLWVFGTMGWANIPLGVATSMFCSIALGIGVDYAIHFLDRLRAVDGGPPPTLAQAIDEVGPAIAIDAVAIALGFGLLAFSQVPANARFGGLVALTLLASSVLTLGGLAALLAWKPRGLAPRTLPSAEGDVA